MANVHKLKPRESFCVCEPAQKSKDEILLIHD